MKNSKIYIKDWLELKPYNSQSATDKYYLNLCNQVKTCIINDASFIILQEYFEDADLNYLSCFLTSYFEDLISGTNIWNTFVKVHRRLYNKYLPFYALEDYVEQEINTPDIKFLMWYFINNIQLKKFISPLRDFIMDLADNIMEVFDKAWDYAPENKYLLSFYKMDEKVKDFFIARNLIDTLFFKTYLFHPDTYNQLMHEYDGIINYCDDIDTLYSLLDQERDQSIHNYHTCLLSLNGKEWAAELLGENHPLSQEYLDMSPKIVGYFFYKGQDKDHVFLTYIATGHKFKMTKESFDYAKDFTEIDDTLYIGIVRWRNEWWFSGVFFQLPYNADIILEEKASIPSKKMVGFLDDDSITSELIFNQQMKVFKDFNNGEQIAFLPSNKIESFLDEFINLYNESLKLSVHVENQAMKRFKESGFDNKNLDLGDISKEHNSGLVFCNPKSGPQVAFDINSAFPVFNNPFYDVEESEIAVLRLMMADFTSTELALYCIEHGASELPFFKTMVGQVYYDNFDFLLRFLKKAAYFTKPNYTVSV